MEQLGKGDVPFLPFLRMSPFLSGALAEIANRSCHADPFAPFAAFAPFAPSPTFAPFAPSPPRGGYDNGVEFSLPYPHHGLGSRA
jgi:hypothetical protein